MTNDVVAAKLDDIKERLIVIETEMKAIRGVDKTANLALTTALAAQKAIEKLEATLTWVWRSMGVVVLAEIVRIAMKMG